LDGTGRHCQPLHAQGLLQLVIDNGNRGIADVDGGDADIGDGLCGRRGVALKAGQDIIEVPATIEVTSCGELQAIQSDVFDV
jgi:hypothetical protein